MVLRGCKLTWLKTNSFFYYYFNETIKKSPNKNQNSKYTKSFIVHFPGHQVLSRSFDKDHQRELGWGLVNPNEQPQQNQKPFQIAQITLNTVTFAQKKTKKQPPAVIKSICLYRRVSPHIFSCFFHYEALASLLLVVFINKFLLLKFYYQ